MFRRQTHCKSLAPLASFCVILAEGLVQFISLNGFDLFGCRTCFRFLSLAKVEKNVLNRVSTVRCEGKLIRLASYLNVSCTHKLKYLEQHIYVFAITNAVYREVILIILPVNIQHPCNWLWDTKTLFRLRGWSRCHALKVLRMTSGLKFEVFFWYF